MADFENTLNLEQMDDPDVAELVRQQLDEDDAFDPDSTPPDKPVQEGVEGDEQH